MDNPQAMLAFGQELARELVLPLLIGAFFIMMFYGLLIPQFSTYWRSGRSDPLAVRLMVVWVMILSTTLVVSSIILSWHYTIARFGDIPSLLISHPTFGVIITCLCLSGTTMQSYFTYRIYRLTKSIPLVLVLAALILGALGSNLHSIVEGYILGEFLKFQSFQSTVITYLVLAAAADVVISVTLVTWLQTRKTGFEQTDSVLSKMTQLTIQTGAITAILALVAMAVFIAVHNNDAFGVSYPLAQVYNFCLMVSLNARLHHGREFSSHSSPSNPAARIVRVFKNTSSDKTRSSGGGDGSGGGSDVHDIELGNVSSRHDQDSYVMAIGRKEPRSLTPQAV